WETQPNISEPNRHGRGSLRRAPGPAPRFATLGKWIPRRLTDKNGEMLYVPESCAHGFITLEPNTSTEYLIWEFYARAGLTSRSIRSPNESASGSPPRYREAPGRCARSRWPAPW